jgi:hypothetical protein
MTKSIHEANRRRWDAGSASWARRADKRGIWRKCHLDPSLALHPAELRRPSIALGFGTTQGAGGALAQTPKWT